MPSSSQQRIPAAGGGLGFNGNTGLKAHDAVPEARTECVMQSR